MKIRFRDLIKLATRMFKARTSRTVLTILGIGVGMATILFLISLGFGVQRVVIDRITTIESLSSMDVFLNSKENDKLNWNDVAMIEKVENIQRVAPLVKYDGQIKIDQQSSNTNFLITEPGYIAMDGKNVSTGEGLSIKKDNGVVLSSAFLKILGEESRDLIGKKAELVINIENKNEDGKKISDEQLYGDFEVVGVVEDEKPNVYVNIRYFSRENLPIIDSIKVKALTEKKVEFVEKNVELLGYRVASVSEVVDQTKKFFSWGSLALGFLGLIALAVSSIGMFNTMVIALLERTEEIGIMKALGATDKSILNIFIMESALIGFLGGVSGVVMGFVVQKSFNFAFNFVAGKMGGQSLDLFHTPAWFVILLLGASLAIGIVTGLIPAKKASAVDPLEALKNR